MNARRITFREVLHLLGPLFGAIFAVWLLRLIFAAAGVECAAEEVMETLEAMHPVGISMRGSEISPE